MISASQLHGASILPDNTKSGVAMTPVHAHLTRSESVPSKLRRLVESLVREQGADLALLDDMPSGWLQHSDLILLPESAFSLPAWDALGPRLWDCVAEVVMSQSSSNLLNTPSCAYTQAAGVARVARQARIDTGGFRQSRAVMLRGPADLQCVHVDNGIKYIL